MSDFLDQVKADAYVRGTYEYTDTAGVVTGTGTIASADGPHDFGASPQVLDLVFQMTDLPVYAYQESTTPSNVKTVLTFDNLGHEMPFEITIERKQYDTATATLQSTDTSTIVLTDTVSFTCECTLADGYAEFTSAVKCPA